MNTRKHAPMDQFPVDNNCLVVGGKHLPDLITQLGHTPGFIYDSAVINERLKSLRAVLPASIHKQRETTRELLRAETGYTAVNIITLLVNMEAKGKVQSGALS